MLEGSICNSWLCCNDAYLLGVEVWKVEGRTCTAQANGQLTDYCP